MKRTWTALVSALVLAAMPIGCAMPARPRAEAVPKSPPALAVDPARRVVHGFGTVDYKRWEGVPTPPTVLHKTTKSEYWIDRQTGGAAVTCTETEGSEVTFAEDVLFASNTRTALTTHDSDGSGPSWTQRDCRPDLRDGSRNPGEAATGLEFQRDFRSLVESRVASVVATGSADGTATLVLHLLDVRSGDTTAEVRASDYLPLRIENTEWSQDALGRRTMATHTSWRFSGIEYVPLTSAASRFRLPPPAGVPVLVDRTLSPAQAATQEGVNTWWLGRSFEGQPLQDFKLRIERNKPRPAERLGQPPMLSDREVSAEYYLKSDREATARTHGVLAGPSFPQIVVKSMPRVPLASWPRPKGTESTVVAGVPALEFNEYYEQNGGTRQVINSWLILEKPDATVVLTAYRLPEGALERAASALQRLR